MFFCYDRKNTGMKYFHTFSEAEDHANELIKDYLTNNKYCEDYCGDYVQVGYIVEPSLSFDQKTPTGTAIGISWNFDCPTRSIPFGYKLICGDITPIDKEKL